MSRLCAQRRPEAPGTTPWRQPAAVRRDAQVLSMNAEAEQQRCPSAGQTRGIPVPAKSFRTCSGSSTTPDWVSARVIALPVLPSVNLTKVGVRKYQAFAARWLAYALPVNASPASSRIPTHDSWYIVAGRHPNGVPNARRCAAVDARRGCGQGPGHHLRARIFPFASGVARQSRHARQIRHPARRCGAVRRRRPGADMPRRQQRLAAEPLARALGSSGAQRRVRAAPVPRVCAGNIALPAAQGSSSAIGVPHIGIDNA